MKSLPDQLNAYKQTLLFTQDTVPEGLLKAHTTKTGVWGKIQVLEGKLLYVIETQPNESIELNAELAGIVEPQMPHHVKPLGNVRFWVEFYR